MDLYNYWLMEKTAQGEAMTEQERAERIRELREKNPHAIGGLIKNITRLYHPVGIPGTGTFGREISFNKRNAALKELGYKTDDRGMGAVVGDTLHSVFNFPTLGAAIAAHLVPLKNGAVRNIISRSLLAAGDYLHACQKHGKLLDRENFLNDPKAVELFEQAQREKREKRNRVTKGALAALLGVTSTAGLIGGGMELADAAARYGQRTRSSEANKASAAQYYMNKKMEAQEQSKKIRDLFKEDLKSGKLPKDIVSDFKRWNSGSIGVLKNEAREMRDALKRTGFTPDSKIDWGNVYRQKDQAYEDFKKMKWGQKVREGAKEFLSKFYKTHPKKIIGGAAGLAALLGFGSAAAIRSKSGKQQEEE